MNIRRTYQKGFSLPELLVVMSIIGILASISSSTFSHLTARSYDLSAESDYRNIKVGISNVMLNPAAPSSFVMRNLRGPRVLPFPMQGVSLSPDTEITIVHSLTLRRNRPPRQVTRITVQNLRGSKRFQYTAIDGTITEQVIELS